MAEKQSELANLINRIAQQITFTDDPKQKLSFAIYEYNKVAPYLKENPKLVDLLPDALPLFNNNAVVAIEQIGRQIKQNGFETAAKQIYESNKFISGEQSMANPKYAYYQEKINKLTPTIDDKDWNKQVTDFVRNQSGLNPGAVYRDPQTGAGLAIRIDKEKGIPAAIQYFDASGKGIDVSIFNAPELYQNADKYGINLKGAASIGEQLQKNNYPYLPGELYGKWSTTSNLGLDFADIARGGLGTTYDWTQDANALEKNMLAGNTYATDLLSSYQALANRLGIGGRTPTMPTTARQPAGMVMGQESQPMITDEMINQYFVDLQKSQEESARKSAEIASQQVMPQSVSMAQQPNVSSLVDMISTNQTNLQQPTQPTQPMAQVMPQAQPVNTYGYELGMLPSSFQFGAPMQVAPQTTPLFSQQNLLAGTQWQPTMSDLTNIIANGQTTISR